MVILFGSMARNFSWFYFLPGLFSTLSTETLFPVYKSTLFYLEYIYLAFKSDLTSKYTTFSRAVRLSRRFLMVLFSARLFNQHFSSYITLLLSPIGYIDFLSIGFGVTSVHMIFSRLWCVYRQVQ